MDKSFTNVMALKIVPSPPTLIKSSYEASKTLNVLNPYDIKSMLEFVTIDS